MPFAAGPNPFTQIRRDVAVLGKQERFAMVVTLTHTAQDVEAAENKEIERWVKPEPTRYTRNALYMTPAKLAKPVATVGLKDGFATRAPGTPHVNFLGPNIEGGGRRVKALEKLLQLSGHMPSGWFAVPGKAARLDQYGNVSRGQITQVLSQLRLQLVAGSSRNQPLRQRALARGGALTKEQKAINAARQRAFARAGGQFFVIKQGESKALPGVYQRQVLGKKVFGPARRFPQAVFIFVSRATYRRRFDWEQVADRTIEERLDRNYEAARSQALATAR